MQEKEKNYVSAVIYLGEEKSSAAPFLETLTGQLSARFSEYELVFVEDASRDGTEAAVKEFLAGMEEAPPVTMVHMSLRQGTELAMNAGIDIAVGDFVYEFDSMKTPYPAEMILEAYDTCLAGSDIVAVSPRRNREAISSLFYRLFNKNSGSKYKLRTDAFRLLSRRAINRVRAMSATVPYRKAAYAASGLRLENLLYDGDAPGLTDELRATRAMDALSLYTDVASRFSLGISVLMLVLMLVALVYIVVVYFAAGGVVEGWTTTMLLLTGGFFGVFLLFTIVLKYLSLLVSLVFKQQKYLVESVEKIV